MIFDVKRQFKLPNYLYLLLKTASNNYIIVIRLKVLLIVFLYLLNRTGRTDGNRTQGIRNYRWFNDQIAAIDFGLIKKLFQKQYYTSRVEPIDCRFNIKRSIVDIKNTYWWPTIPFLLHHMRISTITVSTFMLKAK